MKGELIYLLFSTLITLVGLVLTWWIHSRFAISVVVQPGEPMDKAPSSLPLISVIVPARNEERNICRCVDALLGQTYPNFELIVVDDRSTDLTGKILDEMATRELRLQVIHGSDLPANWVGKPHAIIQGAAIASGDWLCFVDADTFGSAHLLLSAYLMANELHADLFSVLTGQEMGSFWEKVVLPLVFTGLTFGFSSRRVNDPDKPDAIANGQFILIRKRVYQAVGGHRSICDSIVEDKDLARLVKGNGYRLVLADGRQVAVTRMYTSLPEMWEGWTKNIYLGLRDRLGLLLFGTCMGLLGALFLPLWLAGGIAWFAYSGSLVAGFVAIQALILWAYLLWTRARVSLRFNISPLYAFTLPLGALVFTAMMFTSAYKVFSGKGVSWKGRVYG
jgi:chlorobactene glucosyltransferase